MAPPKVQKDNARTFRPDEMSQNYSRNAQTAESRITSRILCFESDRERQFDCGCLKVV
jgi:hypothetical protein